VYQSFVHATHFCREECLLHLVIWEWGWKPGRVSWFFCCVLFFLLWNGIYCHLPEEMNQ
jgi:hypothetical protein